MARTVLGISGQAARKMRESNLLRVEELLSLIRQYSAQMPDLSVKDMKLHVLERDGARGLIDLGYVTIRSGEIATYNAPGARVKGAKTLII